MAGNEAEVRLVVVVVDDEDDDEDEDEMAAGGGPRVGELTKMGWSVRL